MILVTPYCLVAQDDSEHKRFYVGLEMGSGWLALSQNNLSTETTARYALGFYGGYQPLRSLRIGINLGGWLIQPFNYSDPAKGVSVSHTSAQIMVLPLKHFPLFMNLQFGRSVYTNHHPDRYNAKGTALKVGMGYELKINTHLVLPISINYGNGKFSDIQLPGVSYVNQHYEVMELLLGITFR